MKKTLYIREEWKECGEIKKHFSNRKDVNIVTDEKLLDKNGIKVILTLVVEFLLLFLMQVAECGIIYI